MKIKLGRSGLAAKLVILFLLTGMLLALFSVWGQLEAARAERDRVARQVKAQAEINAGLAEDARSDAPDSISRIAREKLGLVEPNEQVFVDANHKN